MFPHQILVWQLAPCWLINGTDLNTYVKCGLGIVAVSKNIPHAQQLIYRLTN